MKNWLTATKIKGLVVIGLFSLCILPAQSEDYAARVIDIKGNAFMSLSPEQTRMLGVDDRIPLGADVIIEDSSQVSLVDFQDTTYHLSGGSHIRLHKDHVELLSGRAWVQTVTEVSKKLFQTANADIHYRPSEFIASFTSVSGRTQLLVIQGEIEISNRLEKHLKVDVTSGKFTFIDPEYKKGMPRVPTNIGFDSYKKIMASFDGIQPMEDKGYMDYMNQKHGLVAKSQQTPDLDSVKRDIASVSGDQKMQSKDGILLPTFDQKQVDKLKKVVAVEEKPAEKAKGTIIFLDIDEVDMAKREPSSEKPKAGKVIKQETQQVSKKHKAKKKPSGIQFKTVSGVLKHARHPANKKQWKDGIEVRVFGKGQKVKANVYPQVKKDWNQVPQIKKSSVIEPVSAAVPQVDPAPSTARQPASVIKEIRQYNVIPDSAFRKSLDGQLNKQRRHSPEVLELINDLKTYDKDYELSY